jgi:hypothetical protein
LPSEITSRNPRDLKAESVEPFGSSPCSRHAQRRIHDPLIPLDRAIERRSDYVH